MGQITESLKVIARKVYQLGQTLTTTQDEASTAKNDAAQALQRLEQLQQEVQQLQSKGVDEETINRLIVTKFNTFTEGADTALDTFREIGDHIKAGDSAVAALLEEIALLKRKDTELTGDVEGLRTFVGYGEKDTLEQEISDILSGRKQ